jgi:hypothetical protein
MFKFLRRRSTVALAVGTAGLAVTLAGGALATTTHSSQSKLVTHDKTLPKGQSIPNVPAPPGSIPSNLVSFDIVAPGRAAEVNAGSVTFVVPPTGWTQVIRVATGDYCLNGSGFNYPATVSVSGRGTLSAGVYGYVEYDSFGSHCAGVEVHTYQVT